MSKAGKKLIDAAKEMLESVKCEHEWQSHGLFVDNGKLVSVTLRCGKCGIRQTTFSR